jgi:hypothetical protein
MRRRGPVQLQPPTAAACLTALAAPLQHCGAVGGALASHFSYFPTWQEMHKNTDTLQRYERIAEEACGREHLVPYST